MRRLGLLLHPLRAALVFLVALAVKTAVSLRIYSIAADPNGGLYELPDFVIHIMCLAGTLLIFSSFTRVGDNYFNPGACDKYLEGRRKSDGFTSEMGSIIRSAEYLIEAAVYLVLTVAFVYAGAYPEVSGSMTLGEPVFSLAILPIFLIISLFSKYEARRYWLSLKLCGEIDSAHSNIRRVLNVLLLLVAYPSVFPYVPYFLYYLLTLLSVFSALADALTVVGLILAIAAIILLFYGLSLLSAFRKRKKLIERIRRTADREGYILSEIRSPLRAMLNPSEPYASFTLTRGSESFVCKFVPTLRRATYFYFTSSTEGYFRHRLGTKHHHITLNHQISFPTGDEVGQRVLIVNPAPKHVFVEEFGGSKEITPGTKIWDAVMYDGETFVGCMERHCLCKTTPWTD